MRIAPRSWAIAIVALAIAFSAQSRELLQGPGPVSDPDAFVEVIDGEFVLGCETFPISGINAWEILERGAGAPYLTGSQLKNGKNAAASLREIYDIAARNGFTVVRGWAHGVTPEYSVIMEDGSYNEGLLRGLDYAIAEARKRGLKLILSFTSNWTPAGGVDQFAQLANNVTHAEFFTDPTAKKLFKDYVKTILTRTNTITGVKYSEDPTIMAWDLINEPVCRKCASGTLSGWIEEMAAYVKSLDSNHLLTVGEEGFYSSNSPSVNKNPAPENGWAAEYDQDFLKDHSDPNIDFAAFHGWPDNWENQDIDFWNAWIQQHIDDAEKLGKPLIFEEFGKEAKDREIFYKAAYDAVDKSLKSGGPLKGALFWQLYGNDEVASVGEGGGAGKFGVYEGDPVFKLAVQNAEAVKDFSTEVTECSTKAKPLDLPDCPPGYEGPACDVDINECARGLAGCGTGAVCINTKGSYDCECPLGSSGNGKAACDDTAAAVELDDFSHEADGQACDSGKDIPYPKEAAGWIEDPTGLYDKQDWRSAPGIQPGVLGSRGPVSAAQCAAACKAARGCTSFTYNDVQEGCYLKADQCAERNSCKQKAEVCQSTSDTGKVIEVPCGSWETYYLKSTVQDVCAKVPASGVVPAGRR